MPAEPVLDRLVEASARRAAVAGALAVERAPLLLVRPDQHAVGRGTAADPVPATARGAT